MTRWWPSRNVVISVFAAVWIAAFHYETLRLNYLSPLAGRALPKLKFLYPPAGWIMFFNVDPSYGMAEVYGVRDGRATRIDPHRIFETRAVGYDNIHRNVLVSVLSTQDGARFCAFLHRKLPDYPEFAVVYTMYPDLLQRPDQLVRKVVYQCGP
jgi:hypothetical protein